jgi:hypothetical protein
MPLPRYKVFVLPEVRADMHSLHDYIAFECFQEDTAERYLEGIQKTIDKLELLGGIISVSLNRSLRRKYGPGVRTISYKNMTIIYTVQGNLVIVRRVIAGKNIK